jgi:Tol biopolymer transport system component
MTDRFEPPRVRAIARRVLAILAAAVLAGSCSSPHASTSTASPPPSTAAGSEGPSPESSLALATPSAMPASAGRIVFVRFDPASKFFVIHTIAPDGSDDREPIPNYPAGFGLVRWSADGGEIAAQQTWEGGFENIVPPTPAGHHHLRLTDPTLQLACTAWSPDGQRLVCEGWSPSKRGREGLYTVRTSDGGDLLRLTSTIDGIHDIPGDYSSDGSHIVFVRATYPPELSGQIWMCNADGSGAHKITDTLSGYHISWSRDGRWIVGTGGGSLLVFDLQDLTAEPLKISIPGGSASNPRWSPDGTRIVFQFTKVRTAASQIDSIAADGTDLRILTSGHNDEWPDWGTPGF